MGMKRVCNGILKWKNFIIVFMLPILLLPILLKFGDSKAARCLYGVLIIGTFWVLEVMPLAVTSLLPVVLFPLLGVMEVKTISTSYFKDTLMLFLGSLIVAVAVERWDLHRRIALRALTLVGPEPRWLMLGIMFPCWFLSMWMSNTATTAMMVPILNAILNQIKEAREVGLNDMMEKDQKNSPGIEENMDGANEKGAIEVKGENGTANSIEMERLVKKEEINVEVSDGPIQSDDKEFLQLAKTFSLCVAFSANIGGVATLTGTPPNIVFKGIADKEFENYGLDSGITFANWLVVGFPLSLVCFVFLWAWMQFYFAGPRCFRCSNDNEGSYSNVKIFLQREYQSLGKMTFAEKLVLGNFIILAILWITRNPQFVPGWGSFFPKGYVRDSVAAILMGVLLFVLPSQPPAFLCADQQINCKKSSSYEEDETLSNEDVKVKLDTSKMDEYIPLLTWRIVHEKLAWGVLLLMGGGFALADACNASGLSSAIGDKLTIMSSLPPWVIVLILTFIVALITNITSNAATTSLFVPIVFSLAIQPSIQVHPLYFMIPITLSASFAFLLPVGTPPNAIVFTTGYLTIKDMVFGGAVVNFVTVLILNFAFNAYISPFLGLSEFPAEFLTAHNSSVAGIALNQTLSNYTIVP